jgi:hypothetical protein
VLLLLLLLLSPAAPSPCFRQQNSPTGRVSLGVVSAFLVSVVTVEVLCLKSTFDPILIGICIIYAIREHSSTTSCPIRKFHCKLLVFVVSRVVVVGGYLSCHGLRLLWLMMGLQERYVAFIEGLVDCEAVKNHCWCPTTWPASVNDAKQNVALLTVMWPQLHMSAVMPDGVSR